MFGYLQGEKDDSVFNANDSINPHCTAKHIGTARTVLEENDLTILLRCTSCRLRTSVSMVIQQERRRMWILDVKIHYLQPIYPEQLYEVT